LVNPGQLAVYDQDGRHYRDTIAAESGIGKMTLYRGIILNGWRLHGFTYVRHKESRRPCCKCRGDIDRFCVGVNLFRGYPIFLSGHMVDSEKKFSYTLFSLLLVSGSINL
jgi:hypothetical protein